MSERTHHLLELQGVSIHYGRAIALASVSLTVEKGELVAVIGPNGTGKTTLLRAISGLGPELEHGKIFPCSSSGPRPEIARRSVVLPVPFGPMTATSSPFSTVRETEASAMARP